MGPDQRQNRHSHIPSAYRALLRRYQKASHRSATEFARQARTLGDPYYTAQALAHIATSETTAADHAVALIEEALELVEEEPREWRRAELIVALADKLNHWRTTDEQKEDPERARLLGQLLERVRALPAGDSTSKALQGTVQALGPKRFPRLLAHALANADCARDDAKSLIRVWARDWDCEAPPIDALVAKLEDEAPTLSARLLGYLSLQLQKCGLSADAERVFERAIDAVLDAQPDTRAPIIRYLAGNTDSMAALERLAVMVDEAGLSREERALCDSTLAGRAAKLDAPERARKWFERGAKRANAIEDPVEGAKRLHTLARGLARLGARTRAAELAQKVQTLIERESFPAPVAKRLRSALAKHDLLAATAEPVRRTATAPPLVAADVRLETDRGTDTDATKPAPRDILALFNTYTGALSPPLLRAAARAAPLCLAFDLDLALIGFPADDLDALIERVATETRIGGAGRALKTLHGAARVNFATDDERTQPPKWFDMGLPVATTPEPTAAKRTDIRTAHQLAAENGAVEGRLLVIMGLGKHGLPKWVLDAVPYHLELTGKEIALETCSAMGILAYCMRRE